MPISSIFILLLLRALYGMVCKNSEKNFGENSLNVHFVKLFSKKNFRWFWVFFDVRFNRTDVARHLWSIMQKIFFFECKYCKLFFCFFWRLYFSMPFCYDLYSKNFWWFYDFGKCKFLTVWHFSLLERGSKKSF